MSALGEAFRTAREARGLTLSEVADHTHIRSVYLAAIEAEDWASIGAAVYTRGFIRTYARFLGLDADDAVKRFSERAPGIAAPIPTPPPPQVHASPSGGKRGGPSVIVVALGLIALVLVAFVGYEYYQYQSGIPGGAPLAAASAAIASTTTAAPEPTPEPADEASPQPAPVPEESMAPVDGALGAGIAVRFTARSWLRLTVDGSVKLNGIYPAGTYRLFTGKRADVRAGNAAGVDVTVNGKHLGAMGAPGDVVERSYNL